MRKGAHHGLRDRQVASTLSLGQGEVAKLWLAALVVQDVAGLQITLDDPQGNVAE
jgi:hypothetical protein